MIPQDSRRNNHQKRDNIAEDKCYVRWVDTSRIAGEKHIAIEENKKTRLC